MGNLDELLPAWNTSPRGGGGDPGQLLNHLHQLLYDEDELLYNELQDPYPRDQDMGEDTNVDWPANHWFWELALRRKVLYEYQSIYNLLFKVTTCLNIAADYIFWHPQRQRGHPEGPRARKVGLWRLNLTSHRTQTIHWPRARPQMVTNGLELLQ